MLDEPSSGLDRDETASFDEVLRHVVAERGCGILLVEHDVSLVMSVCSYIYVMDFGRLIFEGTPKDVAASPDRAGRVSGLGRSGASSWPRRRHPCDLRIGHQRLGRHSPLP